METILALLKTASEHLRLAQEQIDILKEKEGEVMAQTEEFKKFVEEHHQANMAVSRSRHDMFVLLIVAASRIPHTIRMAYVLEEGFSVRPLQNGNLEPNFSLGSGGSYNSSASSFLFQHGRLYDKFCTCILNDIHTFLKTAPVELDERSKLVQGLQEKILALQIPPQTTTEER